MENRSVRNLMIAKPVYLVLYLLLLGLVLVSSMIEYRSRYQHLVTLIQDQAATTAAVVAQSGSGQALLTEKLEQTMVDRVFDVLEMLQAADTTFRSSASDLLALVPPFSGLELSIYDESGRCVAGNDRLALASAKTNPQGRQRLVDRLTPVLRGEESYLLEGLPSQKQFSSLEKSDLSGDFVAAVSRPAGGAIVCHLGPEEEIEFRRYTTLELALEDLVLAQGMAYLTLALDDAEPHVVSKGDFVVDSTWSRTALDDILYLLENGDRKLLEVVRPVFLKTGIGEVRVGFDANILFQLRSRVFLEIALRTILLTVLFLVTFVWLLARQNTKYLQTEKSRIEAEVFRLERLNRLREKQAAMGELAAGVAHEIRNPLNAIGIIAQRLKREYKPETDAAEFVAMTSSMVAEIGRINQSLQEFLEYTKPTPLRVVAIDAVSYFQDILNLYQVQADEQHVSLIDSIKVRHFKADPEHLKHAVSNLIKNGIEACDPGGSVEVSAERSKDQIKISIIDSGQGIPKENLSRIFDLYFTTRDMGTGVGLALAHKIVADHGGSIEVESRLGQGSTFNIHLPVIE